MIWILTYFCRNFPLLSRRLRPFTLRLVVIEKTSSLLDRFRWSWSLGHFAWLSCWSMTSFERASMQTELVGSLVHSDITSGSDRPSCLKVPWSFFEVKWMPILILILSCVYHTHLKRAARGSGSAPRHSSAKAADRTTPTTWAFVRLNKVLWRLVFGRSLPRIECAILRKWSNQVVTLHKWALASLTLWLWNLGSILWRNLRCDPMGCSHCYSIMFALDWPCWSTSLW